MARSAAAVVPVRVPDGFTSTNVYQQFTAPAGATRLFLGIPDGFGFDDEPGAYDDNDGAYRVRVGINEVPDPAIPEPLSCVMALFGLGALGIVLRRRTRA